MSVEMILYPAEGSKDALRKHVLSLGFSKCEHLWDWPEGSLHFQWFEARDYRSTVGVEATIFRPSETEQQALGGSEWALHTRTRVWASSFDREKQNELIRTARRKFGGYFSNDWHGRNRYIPIVKDDKGPAGRGIWATYNVVQERLKAVVLAMPPPMLDIKGEGKVAKFMRLTDLTRVLYNALVPSAVAALEHFLGQVFIILLRYDPQAQERLKTNKRKVELVDALSIQSGNMTTEDVVAEWYSFQNIESIHTAFNEWFGIDFWKLLRQRRKIGKGIWLLEKRLRFLIEYRHGLVHRFEFDLELSREKAKELFDTVQVVMDLFVDHLEKGRGMKIRD